MKGWVICGVILVLFGLLANAAIHRVSCAWYGYQTERDTRYAAFVGCMVKMPNGWVPRAEIRTTQ
ncbi:hypothetical protein [Pseudomonas monteilii]|uniref:hypothetical protein n=1 Tax=Pseudomonas monteilii TaxID=76759 RepID=UPI0002E04233|nr:hypothetical protein [Pseudomonas monteilii]